MTTLYAFATAHPLFVALFCALVVAAALAVVIVSLLDWNAKANLVVRPTPTLRELPRSIAIPTAYRRRRSQPTRKGMN